MCNSNCKGLCHVLNDGICQQYCVKDISIQNVSVVYIKQKAKLVSANGDVIAIISNQDAKTILDNK